VIELKIVDDSSSDTKKMVDGSDLVVIATPLSSYEDVISKIKNSLKIGVILTDVGSVKENIINLVEKISRKIFLGYHLTQLPERKKVDLRQDFLNFFKIGGVF